MLQYGQTGTRGDVPWSVVGDGWFLVVDDTTVTSPDAGTATLGTRTLSLVDPQGGRYVLFRWAAPDPSTGLSASTLGAATLGAWSGDGRRALFQASGTLVELDLVTGATHSLVEPGARLVGYTQPLGTNIVAWLEGGGPKINHSLERIDMATDRHVLLDPGGDDIDDRWAAWLYSRDGAVVYLSGKAGLRRVSNSGGSVTVLPTFASAGDVCEPVRWWDDDTILARCIAVDGHSRLWLYPLAEKPVPLTASIPDADPASFGYATAFRLGTDTFLQHAWDCGVGSIARLNAHGSGTDLAIPKALRSEALIGVVGDDLAITSADGCAPGGWFGFYDPVKNTTTKVVFDPVDEVGVTDALAFVS